VELNHMEKVALSRRDGRAPAAWLVNQNRRSFRKAGRMSFGIARGETIPPWFKVALAALQASRHWAVDCLPEQRRIVYVVRWLRWAPMRQRSLGEAWHKN
jgi:hypothetical protein